MATVKEIYRELFAGKKITVHCLTVELYNSLRTSLQREHRVPASLEMTSLSLCSDFQAEKQEATFWLGESRRKKAVSWEIKKESDEQQPSSSSSQATGVSGIVDEDSSGGLRPTSLRDLPNFIFQDPNPSSSQREEPSERAQEGIRFDGVRTIDNFDKPNAK